MYVVGMYHLLKSTNKRSYPGEQIAEKISEETE